MTAQGDFGRSPGAALPHRGFTEPADGALCSMTRPATDRIADKFAVAVSAQKACFAMDYHFNRSDRGNAFWQSYKLKARTVCPDLKLTMPNVANLTSHTRSSEMARLTFCSHTVG